MSDFQNRLQYAIGRDFLIERELGGGGMSRVFVATETALQRQVVVKVLPPELAAGVNIERFRREIQLAAGLQHPHIVPLLSAGDDQGVLWFTMPLIEGESLRGALTRQKRLPVRDVVRILHDVVDALAYAHARGVVHRDIKPDNILTSGMHALVTDFGVAKALSAAIPSHGGTTTGMAIGTPAYMAPEQLAADPAADHRVDIYAVGLLAYELLTGNSPFMSSSPQATLAAQLTVMPEPPHRSFAEIPEALSAIIMHCLAKDAAKRPPSASALLAELDALPPMAGASGSAAAFRGAPRTRTRTRTRALALAGTLAAAALVLYAQRDRMARTGIPGDTNGRRTANDTMSARDAGRGGSRTPRMEIADAASLRANRAKPETVIVAFRDSMNADGTRSFQVPVVISRAESLAIAEAMQKRLQGAPLQRPVAPPAEPTQPNLGATVAGAGSAGGSHPPAGEVMVFRSIDPRVGAGAASAAAGAAQAAAEWKVGRDELMNEVRRVFTDSMMLAMRGMDSALSHVPRFVRMEASGANRAPITPLVGPNTDGRTRVVVTGFSNVTRRKELGGLSQDVASHVRSSLPSDRYEVIDQPTTDLATRNSRDKMAVGWMLRADFVVSGVVRERNDSLAVLTVLTDVRGGRYSRAAEGVVPMDEPRRALDGALDRVNVWLDSARTRAGTMPKPAQRSRDKSMEKSVERSAPMPGPAPLVRRP